MKLAYDTTPRKRDKKVEPDPAEETFNEPINDELIKQRSELFDDGAEANLESLLKDSFSAKPDSTKLACNNVLEFINYVKSDAKSILASIKKDYYSIIITGDKSNIYYTTKDNSMKLRDNNNYTTYHIETGNLTALFELIKSHLSTGVNNLTGNYFTKNPKEIFEALKNNKLYNMIINKYKGGGK